MSAASWFATGSLRALPAAARRALVTRVFDVNDDIRREVAAIVERVRRDGDAALRALALTYDGVCLDALEVERGVMLRARDRVPPDVRRALARAADNIAAVHAMTLPVSSEMRTDDGVVIGRRADPLARVGVYAPGGRAAYPSSVLMGVVPARIAGVGEIIVCSPPQRDGRVHDAVLAAAAIGGAQRMFALGGAGAIAAMALGTATVPRVDRVVGPGNAYVAEAKLQLVNTVGIDTPAGASELLVLSDGSAEPCRVAREVLAQAEHDPRAIVIVLSTNASWADELVCVTHELCAHEARRAIICASLASRGAVLTVQNAAEALAFSAEFAPEHALLAVQDPDAWLPRVRNAGTVFCGISSSVTFGDYLTGANHVLPTGGLARAYSGLSTVDFMRWTTYQRVDPGAAAALAHDVATLATAEGLPAHAAAALQWAKS